MKQAGIPERLSVGASVTVPGWCNLHVGACADYICRHVDFYVSCMSGRRLQGAAWDT
jgi:hypothetical protein